MKLQISLNVFSFLVFLLISQKSVGTVSDKEYALLPNLFHQDNFEKCMLLGDDSLYCSFEYQLEPLEKENQVWKNIQELSSDRLNYKHDNLRHWICVPTSCPNATENTNKLQEAINECYDKKLAKYGLKGTVNKLECETNTPKYPIDWLDISAALFFTIYLTLVILSTIYTEVAKNFHLETHQKFSETHSGKLINAFSLTKNWHKLKTINNTPEMEFLKPIQTVRFYNTILVVFSHTALAPLIIPVMNTKYPETITSKVATLFLSSGPLCVSTFFVIASSMLTYGIFTHFQQRKLTPKMLILIFINRYMRLAPTLAVVLLFSATWWRHLGSGPNWNNIIGREYLRCRKNWWTNLLFLNTVIDPTNMCLPTFWYLALDTQYFLLLLILIWYLKKYEKYIWHILGTLLLLNILATYINNYVHDFEALNIPIPEKVYNMRNIVGNPLWHGQFISLIGNSCGPIVGVGFGYLYYKTKNMKLFTTKKTMWQFLFFLLSYGPALSIILIPGWYVLMGHYEHDPVISSLIVASSVPIFSLAIHFAVFGSAHRMGGPTNHVMRWTPAYILGRIAYSAYLVHCLIIISRPASARHPSYISDMLTFYYLLGDFTSSYLAGLLLTLFIEMPMCSLQKLLVPTYSKETGNTEQTKKIK